MFAIRSTIGLQHQYGSKQAASTRTRGELLEIQQFDHRLLAFCQRLSIVLLENWFFD